MAGSTNQSQRGGECLDKIAGNLGSYPLFVEFFRCTHRTNKSGRRLPFKGNLTQTLVKESPSSLLKVAKFDDWIRKTVHYDSKPPENRIRQSLVSMNTQPPPKRRKDEKQNVRSKRNCLVIPDDTLDDVHPAKISRLKT